MSSPLSGRRRARATKRASDFRPPDALDVEMLDTQMEMSSALMYAVEMREHQLRTVSHSARVAMTARWLAEQVGVRGDDLYDVQYAARMHEVGMIAVPAKLVRKKGPLTPQELARIRSQARVGAEIARTMDRPLAALMIEHQYTDYETLERKFSRGSREFLLIGILRVADVFDAMKRPRPYQSPLPEDRRLEVLRAGSGTKFHPDAVEALMHARESLN
ncbi:MAG TPA: HD domain-containing phosphohydrolase [Longimicrobiaceae bacterium]|nr:HD domain-containing phosphohydrolase [Longimicrobiaceae bacterium]